MKRLALVLLFVFCSASIYAETITLKTIMPTPIVNSPTQVVRGKSGTIGTGAAYNPTFVPADANLIVEGNVGIGKTNPLTKLDVDGDALINGITVGRSNGDNSSNTVLGYQALCANTMGAFNTATGMKALYNNTTGVNNTAIGYTSLYYNATGIDNTAVGTGSLINNTTGFQNTALGEDAGHSNQTGSYNTSVGAGAGIGLTNLSNVTAIGYNATVPTANSNQVVIGNNKVTSIGGYATWTPLSDGRFKKDIKENVPGLDFILKLRPVTFHWDMAKLNDFMKTPDDSLSEEASRAKEAILYTGFVAQDVETAAKSIGYDFSAIIKPADEKSMYSLGYAEFTVPLVKAVQELSAKNQELEARIKRLEALIKK